MRDIRSKILQDIKFFNRLIFREVFVRNLIPSKLFGLIRTIPSLSQLPDCSMFSALCDNPNNGCKGDYVVKESSVN